MILKYAFALAATSVLLQRCSEKEEPSNGFELNYEFAGQDQDDRSFYVDMDSFGIITPIGPPAYRTATVIVRRDSGHTEVAHVAILCATNEWRQGAFAGDHGKPVVIPQRWGDIEQPDFPADYPMFRVVEKRCEAS